MASRSWLDKQVSYRTVMRLVGILFLAELGGVWALNTSGALALYLSIGFVVFAAIFEFLSFTDKKTLVATASTAATPIASMSQTKDPYRICEQLLKKNLVQGTGAILVCAKKELRGEAILLKRLVKNDIQKKKGRITIQTEPRRITLFSVGNYGYIYIVSYQNLQPGNYCLQTFNLHRATRNLVYRRKQLDVTVNAGQVAMVDWR